ncbi:piggyBac transposable element-derived protein 4 [Trichonephila clavata]|uniref:PiggyBac transposable element-derived protein 4 n=1 Tax=Trichonephila clavata TaxID=2740835 RepID=A0A8X6GS25_TRICU|nr:piggyBac transposable element-derived protein 4 [Trichonephila clavata]
MKDGSKEEFECLVTIEFYKKSWEVKTLKTNVHELNQKSSKWWENVFFRLLMSAVVYCGLKHRKTQLLYFIVLLAEALMASGKLNAQYQHIVH